MELMYYINKGFQILRLFWKSIYLKGNLKLVSPLHKFGIMNTTQIECGNNGKMTLGHINAQTNVHLVSWGGDLSIGQNCSFNRNVIIVSRKQITIGDGTLVGPNVCIYDHDHAFGSEGLIRDQFRYGEIRIGSNVWIGAGVIILRGVTIGDNSIIGAGSVITKDIPNNSLVFSNQRDVIIQPLTNRINKEGISII